ncbi:hypothetical protein HDV00_012645, partial [Rhizophlyctis rosea]
GRVVDHGAFEEFGEGLGDVDGSADEFWEGGDEASKPLPSFVPPRLKSRVVHGAKCLTVLQRCQPDHPLVELQTGVVDGEGVALELEFGFTALDVERITARVNAYSQYVNEQIAEFERMKREGVERRRDIVRDEGRRRKQMMEYALEARREEERKRAEEAMALKKAKEKELQAFMAEHYMVKHGRRVSERETAAHEAAMEAEREAERISMVEEEKRRMVQEHEKRMRLLEEEEERVRMLRGAVGDSEDGEEVTMHDDRMPAGMKTPKDEFGVGDLMGREFAKVGMGMGSGFFAMGKVPGLDSMDSYTATNLDAEAISGGSSGGPALHLELSQETGVLAAGDDRATPDLSDEAPVVEANTSSNRPAKESPIRPAMIDTNLSPSSSSISLGKELSTTTMQGPFPSPPPSAPLLNSSIPPKPATVTDASILWLLGLDSTPTLPSYPYHSAISNDSTPPRPTPFAIVPDLSVPTFVESQLSHAAEQKHPDVLPFESLVRLTLWKCAETVSFEASRAMLRVLIGSGGGREDERDLRFWVAGVRRWCLGGDVGVLEWVGEGMGAGVGSGAGEGKVGKGWERWVKLVMANDENGTPSLPTLRLTPPSPHNLILTPTLMQTYERMFAFISGLLRTEAALKRVMNSLWWKRLRYRGRDWKGLLRRVRRGGSGLGGGYYGDGEDREEHSLFGVEKWEEGETRAGLKFMRYARAFVEGMVRYVFDVGVEGVWGAWEGCVDLIAGRLRDVGGGEHDRERGVEGRKKGDERSETEVEAERLANGVRDLESLYRVHVGVVRNLEGRLVLSPQQEPVRKIVEGLCDMCGEFEKIVRVRCGELPKGSLLKVGGGAAGAVDEKFLVRELCGKFEQGLGMFVKVLVGLGERDEKGGDLWIRLREAIDGNGFLERNGVNVL